jgi:hypothetical protein
MTWAGELSEHVRSFQSPESFSRSPLPNPAPNPPAKLGVVEGRESTKSHELWIIAAAHRWMRPEFDEYIKSQARLRPVDSLSDDDYQKLKTRFEGFPPNACQQCGRRDVCEHLQAEIEQFKRSLGVRRKG